MIRSQKELSEARHPLEQLSSSDKMMLRYAETRDWFAQNQKTVLYALGGLVLVIAGLVLYNSNRNANNERANVLLTRILPTYEGGDYRHAIDGDKTKTTGAEPLEGLRQIVQEYGSTDAGSHASLLLADAYYYLGQYDSAQTAYDNVSSDYPLIRAAAEAGKASVLEVKGKRDEAAKLFESAAKRDQWNPLNADYLLSAARDNEQSGRKDDAVRLYKKLLEEYVGTQFDDAAKRALIGMNVAI